MKIIYECLTLKKKKERKKERKKEKKLLDAKHLEAESRLEKPI